LKKVAVIGLGPNYNYEKDHDVWASDSTKYASNHGASLISRTLIDMFDAEYVDVSDGAQKVNKRFEFCVIAFATHATTSRDVTPYAEFVEKLSIPVALFSLGIQDYSNEVGSVGPLHDSIKRVLNKVVDSTGLIGVRGFYTASLLYKNGYRNVVPIGCPTVFRNMRINFKVSDPEAGSVKNVVNVFHRTVSELGEKLLDVNTVLGQDFLDEVVFCKGYEEHPIRNKEIREYLRSKTGSQSLEKIKETGYFSRNFDDWFKCIGDADFVFGPRLHGCVAGLTQGVPSLMLARDLRVEEIADFYQIPCLKYSQYKGESIAELVKLSSYEGFNEIYPYRYRNFITFLSDVGLLKYYRGEVVEPAPYYFSHSDLSRLYHSFFLEIYDLKQQVSQLKDKKIFSIFKKILPRKVKLFIKRYMHIER